MARRSSLQGPKDIGQLCWLADRRTR
jgi:hypothetical protein